MDRHIKKHRETETKRDRDRHGKTETPTLRNIDTETDGHTERHTEIDTPTNILNSSRDLYEPKSPSMENTWVFLPTL